MRTSALPSHAVRTTLLLMGLITALPALALIDAYTLEWTYQVTETDPMVIALLQHRGALQLALGAAIAWAAFDARARIPVAAAAIATKSVFLALILPDERLRTDLSAFSVYFDLACIVLLAALIALESHRRRRPSAR
ncbi:hypothetical protein [Glycomyces tenuis]|uniref:hypothetical protein n=1 Tax=Glycomyces tenuis TaxID=58116 RepID=UPI0006844FCB|nr:hypothetical protein [Glycomyces tenuis]